MKDKLKQNENDKGNHESQLQKLIKQAGDDARERKRQAMQRHFQKIEAVVEEAITQRLKRKWKHKKSQL